MMKAPRNEVLSSYIYRIMIYDSLRAPSLMTTGMTTGS